MMKQDHNSRTLAVKAVDAKRFKAGAYASVGQAIGRLFLLVVRLGREGHNSRSGRLIFRIPDGYSARIAAVLEGKY